MRLLLAWRLQAAALGGLDPETRTPAAPARPGAGRGPRARGRRAAAPGLARHDGRGGGRGGRLPLGRPALPEPLGGGDGDRRLALERPAVLRPAAARGHEPGRSGAARSTPARARRRGSSRTSTACDAQRAACAAYVKSQASEGWRALDTHYDDGGFSGGSMERPALKRLLADIAAGKVDVVVVYKIDRLTRSLADFVRIVELFDRHGVSFVSVTQAFNTTSSMGRLTLNVLLSFAQFEREVTGERIRDKIAASKARGMWMGGNLPLGYDLPAEGRRALVVNPDEAATVRAIFATLPRARLGQRARALARRARHRLEAAHHPRRPADRRPAVQPRRALLPAAQPHLPRDDRAPRQGPSRHASGDRRARALRGGAGAARRQPAAARRAAGPGGARAADRPHLRCRRPADVADVQLWPAQEALPLLRLGTAAAGAAPSRRTTRRSGGFRRRRSRRSSTELLRRLAPSARPIRSIC